MARAGWPKLPAHRVGTQGHKRARRYYLALYVRGRSRCAVGAETLTEPGHLLDLAHSDDQRTYLGLACRPCNRGPGRGEPGSNQFGGRSYGRRGGKRSTSSESKRKIKRIAGERSTSSKRSDKRSTFDDRERERRQQLDQRERERLDRMRPKPSRRKII